MRKKSLKRRFYLLFALFLASMLATSYLVEIAERSPIIGCSAKWGFIKTQQAKYYTSVEKIVIQPWLGQHNVYGVFMIPNAYRYEYLFRLNLPGENTRCGVMQRVHRPVVAGVVAKPGYYLLKGYLNTRLALILIIQGKLNQLKNPQNWQLGYVKNLQKSS